MPKISEISPTTASTTTRAIFYMLQSCLLSSELIRTIRSLFYGEAISSNATIAHGPKGALSFACSKPKDHGSSMCSLHAGVTILSILLRKLVSSRFSITSFGESHLLSGSPRSSMGFIPISLSKMVDYSQY